MIRLSAISQPLSVAMTPTLRKTMALTQPMTQALVNTSLSTAPRAATTAARPSFSLPGTVPAPMPAPPASSPDSPPATTFMPYFPLGADVPAAALDPAPATTSSGAPVPVASRMDLEKRLMGVPLKTWLLGGGIIVGGAVLLRILR